MNLGLKVMFFKGSNIVWDSDAFWLDVDGCFGYLHAKEKYTLNFLCPCAFGRCAIRKCDGNNVTDASKVEIICQVLVDL